MSVTIFQIDLALTAREKEIEGEKEKGEKNATQKFYTFYVNLTWLNLGSLN